MRFQSLVLLLVLALSVPALAQTPAAPAAPAVPAAPAAPAAAAVPAAPSIPAIPLASRGHVRSFGDDVVVPVGEVVDEVSSFGGDVVIEGRVLHDVSSFGGDVIVMGQVDGDVASMGGEVQVPGAVHGDIVSAGGDVRVTGQVDGEIGAAGGDIVRGAGAVYGGHVRIHHAGRDVPEATGFWASVGHFFSFAASRALSALFVFLLGLVLLGLAPERLGTLEAAMVESPSRVAAHGIIAVLLSALAMMVMILSLVGIPAALLFGMVFPIACYVGLAASARVVGALLPTEHLRGKPVLVLAAGVVVLYAASLVPFVGSVALAVALVFGLGALSVTRFGTREAPQPADRTPAGPFRTRAAEA